MNEFFAKLEDLLDVDTGELDADTVLLDLEEWDSLGTLTVVSMIDEDYGVTILSEELARTETVGQLWALLESKRS